MASNDIVLNRKTRNNYIDFLRGVAALGIIAIHTAFWGGQNYTPEWFQNLTLVLDVPFFFYLSGWASSYRKSDISKTVRSLINVWLKWIFFITLLVLFCEISKFLPHKFNGVLDLRDLINNYMFNVSISGFPVVAGSIWFLPIYFVVILINSVIMVVIQNKENSIEYKKTYMWLLMGAFIWIYYGKYALGMDLFYFLFYSFFWMLGMNQWGKTKSTSRLIIAIIITFAGFCFASYLQGLPFYDVQSAKFPPSLKYGFVSLFAIFIAKSFDGKYKNRKCFLEHIGRNAIFYYFGQGIGSSINYYVINVLQIQYWFVKWILTYIVNIAITIIVAEILAYTYKYLELCWHSVLKRIHLIAEYPPRKILDLPGDLFYDLPIT